MYEIYFNGSKAKDSGCVFFLRLQVFKPEFEAMVVEFESVERNADERESE